MTSALNIAAGGMHAATVRFEAAAHDIVRAGTTAQTEAAEPAAPAGSTGAPVTVSGLPQGDLLGGVIDLKLAEISYKANLKVFEVAARLEDEALDILA